MKQIKPCPVCGSEKVSLGSCFEKLQQVECINCGANGPCVASAKKAVWLWNFAPRKEDVEMEETYGSCLNCKFNPCANKTPGTLWCNNWEEIKNE